MSVVGLPLLLSLFQFINDHEYKQPDDKITIKSLVYGAMMIISAFGLWWLYFVSFCVINSEIGPSSLTNSLLLFAGVLFIIICVMLAIQLNQMVGEGLRYAMLVYILAFIGAINAFYRFSEGDIRQGIEGIIMSIILLILGGISARYGLAVFGAKMGIWLEERQSDDGDNENNDDEESLQQTFG